MRGRRRFRGRGGQARRRSERRSCFFAARTFHSIEHGNAQLAAFIEKIPCDSRAADLLFHIVSRRHERRSIVITTNLAYKPWASTFHDASCVGALIDRLAQHCHTVDFDADSWRDTHALRRTGGARKKKTP